MSNVFRSLSGCAIVVLLSTFLMSAQSRDPDRRSGRSMSPRSVGLADTVGRRGVENPPTSSEDRNFEGPRPADHSPVTGIPAEEPVDPCLPFPGGKYAAGDGAYSVAVADLANYPAINSLLFQ